jgi:hypothetical protein
MGFQLGKMAALAFHFAKLEPVLFLQQQFTPKYEQYELLL